ncbi:restriction endonuclease subunit S [Falsiporphyromonas endometrii]|uniref:Restriction endonuclease subunit S n=1 Tax=Falsiporphyromonas endometrii TaxID=1387297 RepID=A0ABV9K683_9PORP
MDKPKIRFKGFEEAWRKRTLGEIAPLRGGFAFKSTEYAPSGIPIIRISNILSDGTIGAEFIYHQEDANDENYILHDGAALLAMSGATTGKVSILHCKKTDKYYQNQRVGYFQKVNGIDYKYISTITRSILFTQQLYNVLVAGAQPNISAKDVDNFRFYVAKDIAEQEKIGKLFERIDTLLNLQQRKCDKLKVIKKAMLSKMFPKPGKKAPEVRFEGFTDDWVECKLGEIGNTFTGLSGKTKDDFGHGQASFITYMNIFSNPITDKNLHEPIEIDKKQTEVQIGDVFFTTSSETPEEVGMSSVLIEKKGITYLNSFCFGFRPHIETDSFYLAYMLRSFCIREQIVKLAQGISRYNISKSKMMNIALTLPSLSEQKQIGAFFHKLDTLIRLNELKLSKLRLLKRSFLEGMFV